MASSTGSLPHAEGGEVLHLKAPKKGPFELKLSTPSKPTKLGRIFSKAGPSFQETITKVCTEALEGATKGEKGHQFHRLVQLHDVLERGARPWSLTYKKALG